mmetsp:Transcript_7697/g.31265  ORF Transcript_7697/g.31265 Transcript_7697/m.31265 type:complete len:255 (+) Transcript_7697:7754-8518(+)
MRSRARARSAAAAIASPLLPMPHTLGPRSTRTSAGARLCRPCCTPAIASLTSAPAASASSCPPLRHSFRNECSAAASCSCGAERTRNASAPAANMRISTRGWRRSGAAAPMTSASMRVSHRRRYLNTKLKAVKAASTARGSAAVSETLGPRRSATSSPQRASIAGTCGTKSDCRSRASMASRLSAGSGHAPSSASDAGTRTRASRSSAIASLWCTTDGSVRQRGSSSSASALYAALTSSSSHCASPSCMKLSAP